MTTKTKENTSRKTQHPLFGISTKKWIKLLKENGGIDKGFIDRGAFITLSSIFTSPARFLFKLKHGSKVDKSTIKNPPIIIIGHWRSGTTYLHELLSQDEQFCYISLWHTMLPDSFIILDPFKKFLSNFVPKKRPMDAMKIDIDHPYEEEAGLAVLLPWSFFHCFHFGKHSEDQYLKSIHFKGLTNEEKNHWKKIYLKFMKTVSYANNGKRLLLKNPANTARVQTLLEIFPNAKFIYMVRNPYKVYLSMIKTRKKVLDILALQNVNKEESEEQVIENYIRLLNSYFEQKKLIPKENLVDIKYEDLVSDPKKQVEKIYTKFKLDGLKEASPKMNKYLESKSDYRPDSYLIDKKILQRVEDNWDFAIKKYNYKPPK